MKENSSKRKARRIPSWRALHPDHLLIKREWSSRLLLAERTSQPRPAERKSPLLNVVGVGVAEKLTGNRGQRQLSLRFLVRKKYAVSTLARKSLIPSKIDGLPTDVVEVGTLKAFSRPISHPPHGPICPGCSIGFAATGYAPSAGTLGAIVRDASGFFILSSNHVLLEYENQLPLPDIVHPGTLDNPSPTKIAQLERRVPLISGHYNRVDCAIARILPGAPFVTVTPIYPAPQGTMAPFIGQQVAIVGRSGIRRGVIRNLLQDVMMSYPRGSLTMDDQIEIAGIVGPFAEEGDSGAIVIDTMTKAAVGMICGGSPLLAYACPIQEVLARLGVTLA